MNADVLIEISRQLLQAIVTNHVSLHFNLSLISDGDVLERERERERNNRTVMMKAVKIVKELIQCTFGKIFFFSCLRVLMLRYRWVVPKRRKGITTTGCKITLKRAVLMDMLSYEH